MRYKVHNRRADQTPLKDFESAIARAPTPEAVWATFSEYFCDTVVERLVYLHLPPVGAPDSRRARVRARGFPEELVTRYLGEGLYRDNPALRQAHQRAEPVYWDEVCEKGPANEREPRLSRSSGTPSWATGSAFLCSVQMAARASAGSDFGVDVRRLNPPVLKEFQWSASLRICGIARSWSRRSVRCPSCRFGRARDHRGGGTIEVGPVHQKPERLMDVGRGLDGQGECA